VRTPSTAYILCTLCSSRVIVSKIAERIVRNLLEDVLLKLGRRCQPHLWVHEKDATTTTYNLALIACNWKDLESYEGTAML